MFFRECRISGLQQKVEGIGSLLVCVLLYTVQFACPLLIKIYFEEKKNILNPHHLINNVQFLPLLDTTWCPSLIPPTGD